MSKLLTCALLLAAALPAEVRVFWLPTQTNIPGLPQLATEATRYGVQVFIGSDEASKAFEVTLRVRVGGEECEVVGRVERTDGASNVAYSTLWVAWFDEAPQVLSVAVKAVRE